MAKKGESVSAGTTISFVIGEGKGKLRDKAVMASEAKGYDAEYYINNQVLPAIERIFEVLGYTKDDFIGKEQKQLGDFS